MFRGRPRATQPAAAPATSTKQSSAPSLQQLARSFDTRPVRARSFEARLVGRGRELARRAVTLASAARARAVMVG